MRCLSRISRGTPFPSLSRQERGTDTRGVSYFSGDIFFFLLGAIRICPAVPPLYTRDSGTSPNSRDTLRDNCGTRSPKTVGIRQYPCPVSAGHAGQDAGQSPKSLSRRGVGCGTKKSLSRRLSRGLFGSDGGGETWTF